MRLRFHSQVRSTQKAHTLIEVMIGSAILAIVVLANMGAISFSRMSSSKDFEKGIVSDFMGRYLECIKGLPFNQLITNTPINGLYNGVGGTPNIRIPSNTNWISINTVNYQTFHPDLLWLTNRTPQMRVILEPTMSNGLPHIQHLQVEVAWDPPIRFGARSVRRLDLVRVQDQ